MGRLLHFLTHGALLARFVHESSALNTAVPLTSNQAVGPGLIPRMRDTQGIRIFKETQNNILGHLECAHENCKHKVQHIKETVVNDMKVEMILAVE